MPSKEEQKRRKELVRAWQEQEHARVVAEADARLPFPRQELINLFRYIDDGWEEYSCDRTPRRASEYLQKIGLSMEQQEDALEWLRKQGGGCDCEILANVAENWVENFDPREWNFEGDLLEVPEDA